MDLGDNVPTPSGAKKSAGKKISPKKGSPKKGSPKKGSGKKDKKARKTPSPAPIKEETPTDVVPLFLATKTQEIFQCICDEHVTEESPFRLLKKDDIITDMRLRAAISDFHPVKQIVLDYPTDELLVVFDPEFKFGQNFFLCVTEEAKDRYFSPEDRAASAVVEDVEPEEEKVYVYKPPVPKDWIDYGSLVEVSEEMVVNTRPLIKYSASRIRKEFGARYSFVDRDADPHSFDHSLTTSYVSCASYLDNNFVLEKIELDSAVQAVPQTTDGSSQTDWKHPVNATVQSEPRIVSAEEAREIESTDDFVSFVKASALRFESAIQQNVIMDVFFDDWMVLGEEDTNFGSKQDSHLKEYQSFTDLQYSKDKTISCVDWHPQIKGAMGVACCDRYTYDERVEHANRLLMQPSLVLIWSFADPIRPQLLLEGPDDIYCFKFCPCNPTIVAGGCINGQIVLWDISEYTDKLSATKGSGASSNQTKTAMFGEEVQPDTPTVRYCAVSAIESSHRNIVTSVDWIADHYEFNRLGLPVENRLTECCQLISCGTDGHVMVWDTRPPKNPHLTAKELPEKKQPTPYGISQTFKHLDLSWKPLMKIAMPKVEASGDYSSLKLSLPEKQGVRDHVPLPSTSKHDMTKVPSAKNQKPLEGVSTRYFIGTEDGEIVYADFKLEKDNETGKHNVSKPTWAVSPHDGPVNTLQRNPFFNDLLLSVGGWTFCLWRETILTSAILQSACAAKLYTAGHWSLTRPAVFFLGTKDGNIEVWDLLDRTHEPVLIQNVTATQITQVVPCVVSKKQHLIAASDSIGTLHILEIPWNLRHPASNEMQGIQNYLDRETKRIEYFQQRATMHTIQQAEENTRKKLIQQPIKPGDSEQEITEEIREEYENYLRLERKLLLELGVIEEDKAEV